MILYYFPFAQNTQSEIFYACICVFTYLSIFLFTGLIPVLYITTDILKNNETCANDTGYIYIV